MSRPIGHNPQGSRPRDQTRSWYSQCAPLVQSLRSSQNGWVRWRFGGPAGRCGTTLLKGSDRLGHDQRLRPGAGFALPTGCEACGNTAGGTLQVVRPLELARTGPVKDGQSRLFAPTLLTVSGEQLNWGTRGAPQFTICHSSTHIPYNFSNIRLPCRVNTRAQLEGFRILLSEQA